MHELLLTSNLASLKALASGPTAEAGAFLQSMTKEWLAHARHQLVGDFQIPEEDRHKFTRDSPVACKDEDGSRSMFPAWGKSGIAPRAGADAAAWRHAQVLLHSLVSQPSQRPTLLTALRR